MLLLFFMMDNAAIIRPRASKHNACPRDSRGIHPRFTGAPFFRHISASRIARQAETSLGSVQAAFAALVEGRTRAGLPVRAS